MPGTHRRFLAFALAISFAAVPAFGDDKDLLKGNEVGAPPNLYIVFGNSQTMTQTLSFTGSNYSTFDGDADSPGSKLGSAKRVIKDFLGERHTSFNVGMTAFARPPNFGSTTINRKHWIYQAAAVDFPTETWKEPAGTMERWGIFGEGPCTTKTVPVCTDRSLTAIQLPSTVPAPVGPFFGPGGTGEAFIYLDGTTTSNATKRIRLTIVTGKYGDAFTDGTLSTYTLGGTPPRSVEVQKEYQLNVLGTFTTQAKTPSGVDNGTVIVPYVALGSPIPASPGSPDATLFFPTGATDSSGASIAGRSVGFLNEPKTDFDRNHQHVEHVRHREA